MQFWDGLKPEELSKMLQEAPRAKDERKKYSQQMLI